MPPPSSSHAGWCCRSSRGERAGPIRTIPPSSSATTSGRTPSSTTAPRASPPCSRPAACGPRDRVALLLHNRIEFVEALLACHHLGAVAVPINFRLAPDEVEYVLADSGAVAVICDAPPPGR